MRNIIPWKNARDSGFKSKLKAKIAKIVGPLIREQVKSEAKRKVSDAFSRLSMAERVSRLYQIADDRLRVMHFRRDKSERLYLSVARSYAGGHSVRIDSIPGEAGVTARAHANMT